MGEEGDEDQRKTGVSKGGGTPEPSEEAKTWWRELLAETKDLDRLAICKAIEEEHKIVQAEIQAYKEKKRRARHRRSA